MNLTFGMRTPRDALDDFLRKVSEFDSDDLNANLAMDCAVAGWSVLDWVFESAGNRLGFKELRDLQKHCKKQCPELFFLQDIANARKHQTVSRYQPVVQSTGTRGGSFSRSFSRSFDVTRLVINTKNGQRSMFDVLKECTKFYEKYFNSHGI